jgi:hypothetical protein
VSCSEAMYQRLHYFRATVNRVHAPISVQERPRRLSKVAEYANARAGKGVIRKHATIRDSSPSYRSNITDRSLTSMSIIILSALSIIPRLWCQLANSWVTQDICKPQRWTHVETQARRKCHSQQVEDRGGALKWGVPHQTPRRDCKSSASPEA